MMVMVKGLCCFNWNMFNCLMDFLLPPDRPPDLPDPDGPGPEGTGHHHLRRPQENAARHLGYKRRRACVPYSSFLMSSVSLCLSSAQPKPELTQRTLAWGWMTVQRSLHTTTLVIFCACYHWCQLGGFVLPAHFSWRQFTQIVVCCVSLVFPMLSLLCESGCTCTRQNVCISSSNLWMWELYVALSVRSSNECCSN